MRRQRSVSFYAENEDEYIEEYNRKKSISERRRVRSRSYVHNNEENSDSQKNNNYNYRKKFFQSYDDLELDQLGVNSTFQITTIEKEDSEDNEGGLIQKINDINISFKQNNNNSFFSNLAPFTKNIIGPLEKKVYPKPCLFFSSAKNLRFGKEIISNDLINNLKKDKKNNEEENSENDNEDDYGNLLGTGCGSCQMGYLGLNNNQEEDLKIEKRERNNSIIENNCENETISFIDNININELNNSNKKKFQNNEYDYIEDNEELNNNYNYIKNITNINCDKENNLELESAKKHNYNFSYSFNLNNFENSNNISDKDINIQNDDNKKKDDKKMRRYTFDINAFFPDSSYRKEGEESENPTSTQNKTLQNFISKNEFLSKNIDFVDEHLKFLITGSDIKTKHLFLNQLLNEKLNYEDNNYDSFNICKKVIKLLGDYIKLELYEEDCSLCYSHMLNTYIDFSDGVILLINMNIPSSAKYIYDIIEKLKYKINKDKKHFNVILLCFEIIIVKDLKSIHINNNDNNNINNMNHNDINKSKNIINKILNDFELKPNYITFFLDKNEDCIKNDKFEFVINKFLSLAYLKKERKRRNSSKNVVKKHKRGITGL